MVTEGQWLTVPALRELLMAGAIAGVRLWLLAGEPVRQEQYLLFASVTGRVHPVPAIAAYWERRLRDAPERSPLRGGEPRLVGLRPHRLAGQPHRASCPTHPTRVGGLLAAARHGLSDGTLDFERMRSRLRQVEANQATDTEEIGELRDAGRDT